MKSGASPAARARREQTAPGANKPARRAARTAVGLARPVEAEATAADDPTPVVGGNLRRLRTQYGLSLDGLAKLSGVSRAMLGQIELRQSAPTINVLWKIARALNVPFSALITQPAQRRANILSAADAKVLTSRDGRFSSRALFPFDGPRRVEFYELRLAAHGVEVAEPHPPGTVENLIVADGSIEIQVADEHHQLKIGDAIQFRADAPHQYRNSGGREAVMYLVMTYTEEVGR